MRTTLTCTILLCLFLFACSSEKNNSESTTSQKAKTSNTQSSKPSFAVFKELKPSLTGIDFTNQVFETPKRNFSIYDYYYNGAGVAIGDINNDGLEDVFFSGNDAANGLFLNKGKMTFENISSKAGIQGKKWAMGATMVDINNDGFLDIYVCNSGPIGKGKGLDNDLYINNGDNTFTESAAKYGLVDGARSVQAGFADFDKDGDLDMWLNNHCLRSIGNTPQEFLSNLEQNTSAADKRKMQNMYFENVEGKFVEKSKEKGLDLFAFGLGLSIADFNDDGWLDVYTTNDYFIPDYYYINDQQGGFTQANKSLQDHTSFYSMGVDASDFNNDNLLDIAVVDMTPSDHVRNKVLMESMDVERFRYLSEEKKYTKQYMFNSFFLNRGQGKLSNIGHQLNMAQTDWSWSSLMADFDMDGYKDYFVTNGLLKDVKDNDRIRALNAMAKEKGRNLLPEEAFEFYKDSFPSNPLNNHLFRNIKGKQLVDVSKEWGIKTPTFSNGAAYADLDNDGDLDLVVNNLSQPASILENETNGKHNYIGISLVDKSAPSSVLHAKIMVHSGSQVQRYDYSFVRGYLSSMGQKLLIGLGDKTQIDKIEIEYLDGSVQTIHQVNLNKLNIIEKKATSGKLVSPSKPRPHFLDITDKVASFDFSHKENSFDDFAEEVLLPHKYSNLGPCIAVGDVNKDGYDDFYLGGSKDRAAKLIAQVGQNFSEIRNPVFETDKRFEDLGAHFFDFDGDGDLDLYVASGGGGEINNKALLQDRLYLNNGKGVFSAQKSVLPQISSSTSVIKSVDLNGDKKLDLIVGGRNTPGKYPLKAQSYVLMNRGSAFEDVTATFFAVDELPGMITGVEMGDFTGDDKLNLLFVSEWEAPALFEIKGNKFSKMEIPAFNKLKGWWMSLAAADFDKDGDLDFVIGNMGENNKFHPSEKKPLGVLAADFDKNGTHDVVLTKHYKNKVVPVRGKECSTEQMPFLEEKFSTYSSFANSSIQEILGQEKVQSADQYSVNTFSHYIVLNEGSANYTIKKLPFTAQIAPLKSMVCQDFNGDGHIDIFGAGNIIETEPETSPYDAGLGTLLLGKGNGDFTTNQSFEHSGVFCNGNVTDIELIKLGSNKRGVIVGNNDSAVQLFITTHSMQGS